MGEAEGAVHWIVYILECADGSLYTGITKDLDRRLAEHAAGKGARYTTGRGPFRLVDHFVNTCQVIFAFPGDEAAVAARI
jgi:predicted GIY-YIG superfamily endonuclease